MDASGDHPKEQKPKILSLKSPPTPFHQPSLPKVCQNTTPELNGPLFVSPAPASAFRLTHQKPSVVLFPQSLAQANQRLISAIRVHQTISGICILTSPPTRGLAGSFLREVGGQNRQGQGIIHTKFPYIITSSKKNLRLTFSLHKRRISANAREQTDNHEGRTTEYSVQGTVSNAPRAQARVYGVHPFHVPQFGMVSKGRGLAHT
ncbi:hypothetical protein H110_02888 [Trichophyton rubrum MR1448]|nr:hypothetical protein H110_02888 [Trichophyton rubrum MR1448]